MPGFGSNMLSAVFADLEPKRQRPSPLAPAPRPFGKNNAVICGEYVLDDTLCRLWHGTESIANQDCVKILHLTLRRFEYIQGLVSVDEAWDESSHPNKRLGATERVMEPSNRESEVSAAQDRVHRQKINMHALFVNALPRQKLQDVLSIVLFELGTKMLGLNANIQHLQELDEHDEQIPKNPFATKAYLDKLVRRLFNVGLGGPVAERAYAVAADELLSSFIRARFGDLHVYVKNPAVARGPRESLAGPGQVRPLVSGRCPLKDLEAVMLEAFCPILYEFLWPLETLHENILGLNKSATAGEQSRQQNAQTPQDMSTVAQDQNMNRWLEQARDKLRAIRSRQSYDIITSQDTPQRRYGLLDLRELCKDPYGRNLVAKGLEKQIDRQLVRPGTSTVDVLDTYMLIIATLSEPIFDGQRVDPSNVLLTRSAGPVRNFLRNREDAARIVIMSLLEPQPFEGHPSQSSVLRKPPPSTENFSGQISAAMYYHKNPHDALGHFEGDDLLDLDWMPEPVDALSGHRFNMSLDAIGHITTIAPPEAFVKELEHILGERLLKTEQLNFEVEMRLLKIFHVRFGENQIQACENMLNDMMESAKWNEKIRSAASAPPEEHDFQAKIISQASWQELRWDQLQRERFQLPTPMNTLLESYQAQFGDLQADRYLEWVPQLGRVTVDLDLQDRTVSEEVTPLQAAVIHQFTPPSSATRTVDDITTALQGDASSIRAALHFWAAKLVLQPSASAPDTYTVLETLTPAEEQAAAAAERISSAEPSSSPTAVRTRADLLAEHAATYTAYIVGMLTNQGAMEVERIHSLLKMLAPGGFAFDVEDLVGLLEDMAGKGVVARAGALWMIAQS